MRPNRGFTLVEMLVSIGVLAILVLLISRLVNSATAVATLGNKRMDSDSQARPLLDRMAIDFSQMIKRSDVDYFVKQPANPETGPNPTTGQNDQIAFYSQVEGYSPAISQSHLSLVAYRINSDPSSPAYNKLERLAKGLIWNGQPAPTPTATPTPTVVPIVFLPIPLASPLPSPLPSPMPSPSPSPAWPQAGDMSSDPDYETVGQYVFRFEYYYLLKNGKLSETPWDSTTGHQNVAGMQDVAAICVVIAALDQRSRSLLSDTSNPAQIVTLARRMVDFSGSLHQPGNTETKSGDLAAQWQSALDATTDLPRAAITGIRIYQRNFYLSSIK